MDSVALISLDCIQHSKLQAHPILRKWSLQASVALADEILSAARGRNVLNTLTPNSAVTTYEQAYWAAMSNGTQENYMSSYNGLGVSSTEHLTSGKADSRILPAVSE